MTVEFIGTGLSKIDHYHRYEKNLWKNLTKQIDQTYPNYKNLLISLTWFGPQFSNQPGWTQLLDLEKQEKTFDNVFFLASVDPPALTVTEFQEVKNKVKALKTFYLGNFDSPHQFNIFAPILADNFRKYTYDEIILKDPTKLFVNYNRKPKQHRIEFVKKLQVMQLEQYGVITLGRERATDQYITIGEKQADYIGTTQEEFGIPMDYYSLHRLDIWQNTFLYVNAATEFDPVNDLFCQQDTFKPIIGLRPFVINGVQKTYRWLRLHGFKTFNHYWPHIDIENGPVHDTIIELILWLKTMSQTQLLALYQDMLPLLLYNQQHFFTFAEQQRQLINNIFSHAG